MLILVEMDFSTKFNLVQLSYKPTKFTLWSEDLELTGTIPIEDRVTIVDNNYSLVNYFYLW